MLLRPKHLKAIEFLAGSDRSMSEVAAEVGVSLRTLHRWLKEDEFRSELVRARGALPYSLGGLAARASRLLLIDIVRRLEAGGEKPSLKEVTALLAQLAAAKDAPAADSTQTDTGSLADLTPEQEEEIWTKFDEFVTRNQAAASADLSPATASDLPSPPDGGRGDNGERPPLTLPSPPGGGRGNKNEGALHQYFPSCLASSTKRRKSSRLTDEGTEWSEPQM